MEAFGLIYEAVKLVTKFSYSKIATVANFHGNIKSLCKELEKLANRKNDIEEAIEFAETEGKYPTAQVNEWLQKAEEIERDVQSMLENGTRIGAQSCNICHRYQVSRSVAKMCGEVKQLVDSCNFPFLVAERRSPIKVVEKMLAPSLAGQKAAQEMLKQLMEYLHDDGIKRIAVRGMGGVGKTTLVKNLNNLLESSSSTELFDMVIWVTVSKDLDLRKIQSQIAKRLNLELDSGETTEGRSYRLLQRLTMRKKFLLILDDVWEKIDLDLVGVPQEDDEANCKILLTTRSLDVCRAMMTDKDMKVHVLNDEAAWNLFAETAGSVVQLEDIDFLARAVAGECCGLPLAIQTVGKSMRDKRLIELWKNALRQLQHSSPHIGSLEKEVYLPLKLSYNSLPNKILQWCFLYCSLYPENCSMKISELIQCWKADNLIDERLTLEESFNNGIALVETLKDCCMLEPGEGIGTVRIHGVLRDVAIWISSVEKERGFLCQSGLSLHEMPQKLQKFVRRISLMKNMITKLPAQLSECSQLTVLLLQGNPIKKIPDNFFRGLRELRVLNLSCTLITYLPPSLRYLGELRALLLRDCCFLEKLPPLGALCELQMLDLFGTRLRELPKEMYRLCNLKELNLSRTHHLEIIEAGTILGLSSLEALDMSFSAYKWDAKCNVEEGRASFNEILSLERLSVLHIRLDKVDCLGLDVAWLRRLRKFNIRITPRSCDSNYLPTQHDEKRVILRGVDLMDRSLEGLFCNASALDMVLCGGISTLSEVAVRNNLCGLPSLKSLTISSCDSITSLLSGDHILRSMLPNLEHLTLSRLNSLEIILGGMVPKGGCLSKLKTIEVVSCPRLRNLISFGLLRQLQNLEEIKVSDCKRMKRIIARRVNDEDLPKLKVMELRNLRNLKTICQMTTAWPVLKRIEVNNCPMLKQLPLSACNALTIREVRGDLKWWNDLRWRDDDIKFILQQRFQACADSTMLTKEDRWA